MSKRLLALLAVLLSVALIAAACGSDDDDSSSSEATAEPTEVEEADEEEPAEEEAAEEEAAEEEPAEEEPAEEEEAMDDAICAAGEAGVVEIVHLTEISGESPTAIDEFWNGSSMAAAEINELCGAEIVSLERIPADFTVDGLEPKLLEAQEAEPTAIIGQGSSSQIALNSVVDEAEIPMLWPVGTAAGMSDGESASEWAWMVRPVNDAEGLIFGTYLTDAGFENIWLECVETQFGVSACAAAKDVVEGAGNAITGERTHPFDETDFTSSIVDLKAAGTDAVALPTFPSPEIGFMNQMEENDALDIIVMGGSSTEIIFKAWSEAVQDVIIAQADCNPHEDDPEVNAAYNELYEKDMIGLAAIAYDSVYIVVDAVAREGSTENTAVAAGISSTEWSGVCQDYFDSGSHALAHSKIVTDFKGGTINTIAEFELDERGDGLAE
jgi:ABC-type branched-subunit amino acid transport system substrate-binding protein